MLISFGFSTIAQVAINSDGSEPDGSAILDLQSTSQGLLLPRLTTLQISGISNPAAGLITFNTDSADFYGFNGNEWVSVWNPEDILADWYCGNQITDSRDGQNYTTVQIGTQCWMAENLNVGTRIDGVNDQTDNSTMEKYCYDNDVANCDTYGGLYQWNEMMQYVTTEGVQGICPDGWYLPTNTDWTTLSSFLGGQYVAGNKMKSTSGWYDNGNGTNSSGFTGLPGGYRDGNGYFNSLTAYGVWWSSTESSPYAKCLVLARNSSSASQGNNSKTTAISVRCLKNNN